VCREKARTGGVCGQEVGVVISGHHFKRIQDRRRPQSARVERNREGLVSLLNKHVVERFAQLSSWVVNVRLLIPSGLDDGEDGPPDPCHPSCAEHDGSDYCRESWQLHLAELTRAPETHWHRCDYGRYCAQVPIVCQGRCVAALTLACSATVDEAEFERQLDLLDALARQFVAEEAAFLGEFLQGEQVTEVVNMPAVTCARVAEESGPSHPQVIRAMRYIEEHLSDPSLTVARIAEILDIHPHYLSSLFASQVGRRMNRFITSRRMELAKTLLSTTAWQVKRIARETGHANTAWFCHLFGECTGATPREYRDRFGTRADAFQI
jgi:AraC-like DNA-binding protein